MIDIINAHVEAGYSCTLFTGRLVERNIPLNKNVKIKRLTAYNRKNILTRLNSWIKAFFNIFFLLLFNYRDSNLFIVSNPPFGPIIPLFFRNRYSLLFFDVYIETLEGLPYIGKITPLINLWKKCHKKVLKNADNVFTLTDGMKSLLEKYSGKGRVEVVSIWSDNNFLRPVIKSGNPFIIENGLTDKFVVLYSGNLGSSSGLESLLKVASEVKEKSIQFVIIGDGIKKNDLQKTAEKLNLSNIIFLPWQDTKALPYSLGSADLAVVSLASSASRRSIPSKLYNFFSVGAPILCIADKDSDLSKTVTKFDAGRCFEKNDIRGIADFIRFLATDSEVQKKLKRNSLLASTYSTPLNSVNFIRDYNKVK
jgi:glycosyltransferase involved in cell wall biosynthesis